MSFSISFSDNVAHSCRACCSYDRVRNLCIYAENQGLYLPILQPEAFVCPDFRTPEMLTQKIWEIAEKYRVKISKTYREEVEQKIRKILKEAKLTTEKTTEEERENDYMKSLIEENQKKLAERGKNLHGGEK